VDMRLVAASYEVAEVRSAPLPEHTRSWAASFSPRCDFNRESYTINAVQSSTVVARAVASSWLRDFPRYRKSTGTVPQRTVHSVADNFSNSARNFDLGGLVERFYSGLDDSDGDVNDLGLVGSGCLMSVTVLLNSKTLLILLY